MDDQPTYEDYIAEAKEVAARFAHQPKTPGIEFTEGNPELMVLYDDLRRGQLTLDTLKGLDDAKLSFVAAHSVMPPGIEEVEWGKLRANAIRAGWLRDERIRSKQEDLNRKMQRQTVYLTMAVTFLAAVIAAAVAVYGFRLQYQMKRADAVRIDKVGQGSFEQMRSSQHQG